MEGSLPSIPHAESDDTNHSFSCDSQKRAGQALSTADARFRETRLYIGLLAALSINGRRAEYINSWCRIRCGRPSSTVDPLLRVPRSPEASDCRNPHWASPTIRRWLPFGSLLPARFKSLSTEVIARFPTSLSFPPLSQVARLRSESPVIRASVLRVRPCASRSVGLACLLWPSSRRDLFAVVAFFAAAVMLGPHSFSRSMRLLYSPRARMTQARSASEGSDTSPKRERGKYLQRDTLSFACASGLCRIVPR